MNRVVRITWLAGLIVACTAVGAWAGRGGGGGFHGGARPAGGGPTAGRPAGGFQGGSTIGRGGNVGVPSRLPPGHTPSLSVPRADVRPARVPQRPIGNPQRPGTSNVIDRSRLANRPTPGPRPDVRPKPDTRPRPDVRPRPGQLPSNTGPRHDWAHHDWYHGDWHGHWDHPWHRWPHGWYGAGVAWGVAVAAPWSWGYWSYSNPYYVAPVVVNGVPIDYSQPIAAAVPAEPLTDQGDQASELLDAAREAFLKGDYLTAIRQANQAIALNPGDSLPHEFRALAYFAAKQYKAAAAGLYAVLSAGPGWDWTTMSSFYQDVNTYTAQLRALEQYVDAHRNQADARFVLAYHYLTCGHTEAAVKQLEAVVQLNPKDQLSAQLLASLTAPAQGAAAAPKAPAAPAGPATPIDAATLVGDWKAEQPDGSTISLSLTADRKYTWRFTREGKSEEHSGPYTVADNLLILKEGDNPVMVGQVTQLGNDQLNFKLPSDNLGDPGLTFSR